MLFCFVPSKRHFTCRTFVRLHWTYQDMIFLSIFRIASPSLEAKPSTTCRSTSSVTWLHTRTWWGPPSRSPWSCWPKCPESKIMLIRSTMRNQKPRKQRLVNDDFFSLSQISKYIFFLCAHIFHVESFIYSIMCASSFKGTVIAIGNSLSFLNWSGPTSAAFLTVHEGILRIIDGDSIYLCFSVSRCAKDRFKNFLCKFYIPVAVKGAKSFINASLRHLEQYGWLGSTNMLAVPSSQMQ